MIVKDQPSSLHLFFAMQGSIIPSIFTKVMLIAAFSLAVLLTDTFLVELPRISITAMGVFGIAMSLFLGFRNNAAYDRWWDGRCLWGSMIAESRNLARHSQIFISDPAKRSVILSSAMASFHLLRGQLRNTDTTQETAEWVGPDAAAALARHSQPHDAALSAITECIGQLAQDRKISDIGRLAISKTLANITQAQAGCERISNTPLPYVYSLLIRRTTHLYCWLLPFALLDSTGGFAPVLAAFVAYVFFGLQAVTNELERPFTNIENGLPLDAMCRTIEITLAEALGRDVPPPLTPVNFVIT